MYQHKMNCLDDMSAFSRCKAVQSQYLGVLENLENAILIANIGPFCEALGCRKCQLGDVLNASCRYAADLAAGCGVEIIPPSSGLGVVSGDFCLLHKALSSLLKISVLFSKPRFQIKLNVQLMPEGAALTIESHGFSIPTAELPRFFSVSPPRHTGTPIDRVGLAPFVADRIISLLGGVVVACNLASGGVRFHVFLSSNPECENMGSSLN